MGLARAQALATALVAQGILHSRRGHRPECSPARLSPFSPEAHNSGGQHSRLAPEYAENTTPLFGRADFFKALVITFAQDANLGDIFHLDF